MVKSKVDKQFVKELAAKVQELDTQMLSLFKTARIDNWQLETDMKAYIEKCLELKLLRDKYKKKKFFEGMRDFSDNLKAGYEARQKIYQEAKDAAYAEAKKILQEKGFIFKDIIFKGLKLREQIQAKEILKKGALGDKNG